MNAKTVTYDTPNTRALGGGDNPISERIDDCLQMRVYARSLAEVARNMPTPFTIALQGEWGSGKTSLMNLIYNELCGGKKTTGTEPDNEQCGEEKATETDAGGGRKEKTCIFYDVWVNAWKYTLLMRKPEEVLGQITSDIRKEIAGKVGPRTFWQREWKKTTTKNGWVWRATCWLLKPLVKPVTAALWIASGWFSNGNYEIVKVAREVFTGGAKDFCKSIGEDIEACLKNQSGKKSDEEGRFIFFIDDLDRIDPSLAVQILDVLQNLFVIEKCVFILAIDYNVVAKGLEEKFGGQADVREYRSYFDKIIQLPFRMPVERYDINELLKKRLEDAKYFDKDDKGDKGELDDPSCLGLLVDMARLSIGHNPRSIKRLAYLLGFIRIKKQCGEEEAAKNEKDAATTVDMPSDKAGKVDILLNERQMCFGVVCIQMAYQGVYLMLQKEANFLQWGEESRGTGVKSADDSSGQAGETNDADKHQMALVRNEVKERGKAPPERVDDIVELLKLIAGCCARESLGQTMKKVLDLVAAAVGGEMTEQIPEMSEDGFFRYLANEHFPKNPKNILKEFLTQLKRVFMSGDGAPLLHFSYSKDGVEVYAASDRVRCLLKWRLYSGSGKLKYTVGNESEEAELGPRDSRSQKTKNDIWNKLLKAYNDAVPEGQKLDADFVERHWVNPLSAPEPNDAAPAA